MDFVEQLKSSIDIVKVIDPDANDADTLAIRALNKKLLNDTRINLSMVPISDGLTLCYKR